MKVMQVLPAMQGGGVERGTVEIATALSAKNIDNVVVSAGGRLVPELDKIGVKHITLDVGSKNPLKFVRNIFALRRIIRDENVTIVHFISKHILSTYHIPEDKIRLVYRGADVDKFNAASVSVHQIEDMIADWQLPVDKTVILMPGRLSRQKGHLVVLEALQKMRHKDVVCVFVGSDHGKGEYRKELQSKIDALDDKTTVLLKEHCNNIQ